MKKIYSVFTAVLLTGLTVFAQEDLKHCGTDEIMWYHMKNDPQYAQRVAELDQEREDFDREFNKKNNSNAKVNAVNQVMGTVYTIPVVFHILHLNGNENISNAQVNDAMAILNRDYRKNNADSINIVPQFVALAGDAEIEFKLATIDPNGACTNGIVRHYDANTDWQQLSPGYSYTWPRNKYLNVYVVRTITNTSGQSGVAGYTYKPGNAPSSSADCIVILNSYVGSIGTGSIGTSRALTHEVGHWLNLSHVWGSTNQPGVSCGNDGVSDTPITEGYTSCQLTNNDICNAGIVENVQNYMEYSYCSNMFTNGQITVLRNTLINNTGNVGRNNLWTASNLSSTGVTNPQICVPVADFKSNKTYLCTGNTVQFSDDSQNAHPTGWNWTFTGGTPATSTDSMPIVSYSTPGIYAVSYTASTSAGSNSITKTTYITVLDAVANHQTFWNEGFESISSLPSTEWNADNLGGGNTWSIASVGYSGTKSAKMNNFGNTANEIDELVGPSVNVDSIYDLMGAVSVTFKVAYQQQASTNIDKLQLLTSTDCGATWVSKWSKQGSTLATTTTGTTAFTPSSTTQWRNETVNLISLLGQKNVKFKFKFTSDASAPGNNLYVDDININGINGISNASLNAVLDMNLYPNPTEGTSNLTFNLDSKHNIQLFVSNILGQTVENLVNTEMSNGQYSFKLNKDLKFKSGIYLVNLVVDGKLYTRKLVIE